MTLTGVDLWFGGCVGKDRQSRRLSGDTSSPLGTATLLQPLVHVPGLSPEGVR